MFDLPVLTASRVPQSKEQTYRNPWSQSPCKRLVGRRRHLTLGGCEVSYPPGIAHEAHAPSATFAPHATAVEPRHRPALITRAQAAFRSKSSLSANLGLKHYRREQARSPYPPRKPIATTVRSCPRPCVQCRRRRGLFSLNNSIMRAGWCR